MGIVDYKGNPVYYFSKPGGPLDNRCFAEQRVSANGMATHFFLYPAQFATPPPKTVAIFRVTIKCK